MELKGESAWTEVGRALGRLPEACRDKWGRIARPFNKGRWAPEESASLQAAVEAQIAARGGNLGAAGEGGDGAAAAGARKDGGKKKDKKKKKKKVEEEEEEEEEKGVQLNPLVREGLNWEAAAVAMGGTRSAQQCAEVRERRSRAPVRVVLPPSLPPPPPFRAFFHSSSFRLSRPFFFRSPTPRAPAAAAAPPAPARQQHWYGVLAPSMTERGEWGPGDDRRLLAALVAAVLPHAPAPPPQAAGRPPKKRQREAEDGAGPGSRPPAQHEADVAWGELVAGRPAAVVLRRWKLMRLRVPRAADLGLAGCVRHLAATFAPELLPAEAEQPQGAAAAEQK